MNTLPCLRRLLPLLAAAALVPAGGRAADALFITEFMAINDATLADEDGDHPDWIEIYNAGTNTVNLNGWCLTDQAANLTQWRFPATNLPVNTFMLVYASNKDRRTAGRPLHTNFKLANDTGYLALVKPDGTTIQSSFSGYPQQVAGVAYGLPVTLSSALLISNGSPARFTVPLNDALGAAWLAPGFDDGSWVAVTNGVGFEGDTAPSAGGALLADAAAEFSGTQGGNNWFYGYWDKKADTNGTYETGDFTPFPRGTGNSLAPTNYWDGTKWDWPSGNPPWTELTSTGGHPAGESGNPALPMHWAIRRYVSETNGPLRLTGLLACSGSSGACGDGVVGHIFVDGVEVWQRAAFNLSIGYSIIVTASLGSMIDFAIDPGAAANDFCDGTTFTASIRTAGEAAVVADSIEDWSFSGTQGEGNWFYGLYNRTIDADGTYQSSNFVAYPGGTGPHSTANFWNGAAWQWFDGDPPFDWIGQVECLPSIGTTSGASGQDHRVVRRWVSEVAGTLQIDWHLSMKIVNGANGVIGRVYRNNTQLDTVTVGASDFTGAARSVTVAGVREGDFIDFMIDPNNSSVGDLCFLNATLFAATSLSNQFASNVGAIMTNINSTAYVRFPFTVADPSVIDTLTLRMKYADGFVAFLNGVPVASANAPAPAAWDSAALARRLNAAAAQFEDFSLDGVKDALTPGTNVLAIHALNAGTADQDFLIRAELIAGTVAVGLGQTRYFALPTPGSINGGGTTLLGPLIANVAHMPREPADTEDLFVTAKVAPTFKPLVTVKLYYRVMYNSESSVVMLDDGRHGDGLPGDGVYGAAIPNTAYVSGQMVRYYITATDSASLLTRLPSLGDTNNSSLYLGTVVKDPTLTNDLPVLHWFIQNPTSANNATGGRGSIYFNGQFRDNVKANLHGQSSSGFNTLKKSYNFDLNPGETLRLLDNHPKVDDFNLLTTYADKSQLRNMINYNTYSESGTPAHFAFAVRVQQNGAFFAVYNLVENGDENYLQRIGFDVSGALYKMYNSAENTTGVEKKTRKTESNADLQALITGSSVGSVAARQNFVADNMDVPGVINFLAVKAVTSDHDCCHKNYYFYRDTPDTGEWVPLPWDADLSFGRIWSGGPTYFDDVNYTNAGWLVGGNTVMSIFFDTTIPKYRQMYMRRVRTLTDRFLGVPGTTNSYYDQRIEEQKAIIRPDAALDFAKWATWGTPMTMDQNANQIRTNYIPGRRAWLNTAQPEIPGSQSSNVVVKLLAFDYNPSSGNQAQEFISITNPNAFAVDISDWRIAGGVGFTFKGGTVLPPNSAAYVTPDKAAFRARTSGPRGGQGLLVLGPYAGQLSARGESLSLSDEKGRLVSSNGFIGTPSLPQQYLRITEIMYHPPAAPAGSPYDAEDFEYIEFRNIGPISLSLAGVHFTNGVEFTFPAASLAPGEFTLVVRNAAAFTSRYGTNLNVAGAYTGSLDNAGENLRLDDAVGEKILDFTYQNQWYPITDGPGASLVIVDATADWKTWDLKAGWRPSAYDFGSPAATDPGTNAFLPVFIHEVLSHSEPPLTDAIELFNPNATPVNISGWFLSDDLGTPKKFRVPDGTTIPAAGFTVFHEAQFNPTPGVPPSFALSSFGDETYVFSGNGTNLTGWFDGQAYGATENGVSLGRYTNSQGAVHFVAQSSLTLSNHNALPRVGPVVVSEIMYHPPELPIFGDNAQDEFIELANISGTPQPLFDPANPTHTWRLRSSVDFDFPANVTLPAAGFAMIVNFYPTNTAAVAAFRARFSIPTNVPIFGPWSGKLDNSGGSVKLEKPDASLGAEVPYVLVDRIDYSDAAPWATVADGQGGSLQRLVAGAYGNDPTNWIGAAPTGGAAFVPGGFPVITVPPASASVLESFTAMFSVTVTGTPPFAYQWQFNGNDLVGANSSVLNLPNVSPAQAGAYRVIVLGAGGRFERSQMSNSWPTKTGVIVPGAGGAVESADAILNVFLLPRITAQPTNTEVRVRPDPSTDVLPITNASFTVVATSFYPPLSFQWRMNGTNLLPSAHYSNVNAASLIISNVTMEDFGDYTCALIDRIGTNVSSTATLFPLVRPTFLLPFPNQTQTVVAGSSFAVSAVLSNGWPPPFGYQWRSSGSTIITNLVSDSKTNFFVYPGSAVSSLIVTGAVYRVVVTNRASPTVLLNVPFYITTLLDTDHDGIPDSVESALGLNPNSAADALLDLDGDGMSNLAEYQAGTDPANAASYLKIEHSILPGAATLRFAAVSNRTYTIQFSGSLGPASWSPLADFVSFPTNRVEVVMDPEWTTNRFYRVVTPRVP